MSNHFYDWCENYREYLEEWFPLFRKLFIEEKMEPPTRKDFYWHCYKNSCPTIGDQPPIIPTPERYMEWFTLEKNLPCQNSNEQEKE